MGHLASVGEFVESMGYRYPSIADQIVGALGIGIAPSFGEIQEEENRQRGLSRNRQESLLTEDTLWGDIRNSVMPICFSSIAPDGERVEATSTGAVA